MPTSVAAAIGLTVPPPEGINEINPTLYFHDLGWSTPTREMGKKNKNSMSIPFLLNLITDVK